MGDDAAAPAAAAEWKIRAVGDEGIAALEDVDGVADVVLACGDKQYVVARKAAEMIPLVASCLEQEDPDKGAAKEEEHLGQVTSVALPVVTAAVAAAVIEYCEKSAADGAEQPRVEKPLRGKVQDCLPAWAAKFVLEDLINEGDEKQHAKLFEVLMGAHALGVKPLEDLCGLAAASMLKGKTPAQIRDLFALDGDFQPEEEEKINDDTKWAA